MTALRRSRHTLLGRIILLLTLFGITFLLQLGIDYCESRFIMQPMEERTERIQGISQFLFSADGCMATLKDYRWDYGDTDAVSSGIRNSISESSRQVERIQSDVRTDSEEYCLLAGSVHTTYDALRNILSEILIRLSSDQRSEASQIYYNRAVPCGEYLIQYTRQLLEQAIQDYHDAFETIREMENS